MNTLKDEEKIIELMKPRYMVIAKIPFRDIKVGTIIEQFTAPFLEKSFIHFDLDKSIIVKSYLDDYPHIFRELAWWEGRRIDEMPGYVKMTESKAIYKVPQWMIDKEHDMHFVCESPHCGISVKNCLPATETEYLNYKPKN